MVYVSKVLDIVRICIIIPVYNEERTIGSLVRALKKQYHDVVVINDGSSDCSEALAREEGAHVITHFTKQGKGVSLRDGFQYALDNDFDGVVTMDGDGQHAIDDVAKLIEKAEDFPDGIVNGSRMKSVDRMPVVRYWTNRLMSFMISVVCRQRIIDSQCGFRFIPCCILRSITLQACDFEIETEVLVRASRKGFRIHSVAVQTIYQNESSKINPFLDTFRFFTFMLRELIKLHR